MSASSRIASIDWRSYTPRAGTRRTLVLGVRVAAMGSRIRRLGPYTRANLKLESRTKLDLHLDLDAAPGRSLRGRLENSLRDAIRSGLLVAETRLPSSRELCL